MQHFQLLLIDCSPPPSARRSIPKCKPLPSAGDVETTTRRRTTTLRPRATRPCLRLETLAGYARDLRRSRLQSQSSVVVPTRRWWTTHHPRGGVFPRYQHHFDRFTAHGVWPAKKRRAEEKGRNGCWFFLTFSSLFLQNRILLCLPAMSVHTMTCWAPS